MVDAEAPRVRLAVDEALAVRVDVDVPLLLRV